eukprot:CAMPEP_0197186764 /NCGR_PEP_ID=MMETSP1423-20130617/14562_1 /TAXON_ID=476441 /ORGANISM="Pseudo-nitzschia heimii, Strain UNC1101" /LENGTH=330 /DNA_ID=CAMNT_0042638165 /DNA_START=122 /DNA_END=1114 /DNA_ORIENTATION=+
MISPLFCFAIFYLVNCSFGFTPISDYRCTLPLGHHKIQATEITGSQFEEITFGAKSIINQFKLRSQQNFALQMATKLRFSNDDNGMTNSTLELSSRVEKLFPKAQIITTVLPQHVPLGCTVEESLHEDDDCIFISKLTKEGNAEGAGLEVGDVIVAVTGVFGKLECTIDADVEKIKQLVSAVADEDPLTIEVVRGTGVLARHESTIVDLCSVAGTSDKDVQECVVDFLSGGYDYDDDDIEYDEEDTDLSLSDDEDAEGLIDGMMNLWADELQVSSGSTTTTAAATTKTTTENTEQAVPSKPKPKPWSSRSSPSGTWVRDPASGKMINIDA